MVTESDVNKLVEDVERITKRKELDLSSDADLSIGIMNLINLEEHLFFTAMETGKDDYLDILQEVRRMRAELLKKIVKESEGEVWCISKHLLTAAMRLMETGTKRLEEGNKDEAKSLFEKSYRLYSLFWEINSRAIYSKIEKEETAVPEKIEVKAPAKKEIEPEEKVVFVPVCKELL
ncbi:MAG TPA: hypothetical protein VLB04_07320 [Methanotrichaceae archaeon]|nr:hypothetical protein [Methanotrichaceae archaeon]